MHYVGVKGLKPDSLTNMEKKSWRNGKIFKKFKAYRVQNLLYWTERLKPDSFYVCQKIIAKLDHPPPPPKKAKK